LALAIDTRMLDFHLFFEETCLGHPLCREWIIPEAVGKLSKFSSKFSDWQNTSSVRFHCVRKSRGTVRRRRRVEETSNIFRFPESDRSPYIIHENTWPGYCGNRSPRTRKLFCLYRENTSNVRRMENFNPISVHVGIEFADTFDPLSNGTPHP